MPLGFYVTFKSHLSKKDVPVIKILLNIIYFDVKDHASISFYVRMSLFVSLFIRKNKFVIFNYLRFCRCP